jgi:hypothetical protein
VEGHGHRTEYELIAVSTVSTVEFMRTSHQSYQHGRFFGIVKLLAFYNGSWHPCEHARYDAFELRRKEINGGQVFHMA